MQNRIKDYVSDIKAIQDILRKDSLQEYYRYAILGFTVLRRLMQTLEPTQEKVNKAFASMKKAKRIDEDRLMSESGFGFYNVCGMKFEDLLSDSQKIFANIKHMIESFSKNVSEIFASKGLNLVATASAINDKDALYEVISKFSKLDFSLQNMDNANMGTLFGELVQMTYGTVENGENFTPSDISGLLTRLLFAEGCDKYKTGTHQITLLDNCCGTSSMLTHCEKYIKEKINSNNDVLLCGQDNSGLNIAVCKAEQLMMGQDPSNFRLGDTLTKDKFGGMQFDLALQNAPYGEGRKKKDEEKIKAMLGDDLPCSDDNQMLFWKAAIKKLKNKGRMVFLSNGSPLFSGATLSGESKIRKWLFDNDYIEAIIKLPDQGFIDTGINVYAWVLSKGGKKGSKRENVIQLINAESIFYPMKKSVGFKRKELRMDPGCEIDKIVNLYTSFPKQNELVKNVRKENLYYYEVLIQQPYHRNFAISKNRIGNLYSEKVFNKLYDDDEYNTLINSPATQDNLAKIQAYQEGKIIQNNILEVLNKNVSNNIFKNKLKFEEKIRELFPNYEKKIIDAIIEGLSEIDNTCDVYPSKKSPSGLLADSELNDSEYIPVLVDVKKYFEKEVKPFLKDSWFVFDNKKMGCEINFNNYFFKYTEPTSSKILLEEIKALNESSLNAMNELIGKQ